MQLRTGHVYIGDGVGDDELEAAWLDLCEQVAAEHADHHRLGWPSRPYAWWRFEQGQAERRDVLAHHCTEAAALLALGELDPSEVARLRVLVPRELACRRLRAGMDSPEWLDSIEALSKQLGIAPREREAITPTIESEA